MKLYEIDQAIENLIDDETGEVLDLDAFLNLKMERDRKIENMALWVKNMTAEAKAYKEEKEAFAARERATKNKLERVKKYLSTILGNQKFSTSKVAISFRKSESVEVDDTFLEWAKKNADDLLRYKEPEIDKKAIKEALKNGKEIKGAYLKENQSIQIK